MFQTEVNHFFQQFAGDFFTPFMVYVSHLGAYYFYLPALIVLLFGVDFKKGFLIFQGLIVTSFFTQFFKEYFALPRPLDVDNSLEAFAPHYNKVNTLFTKRGSLTFWGLLPEDIINYYQRIGLQSYGFPSGHVSAAVGFWGSTAIVFASKRLWLIFALMVPLMMVSRLFLPKHFLADVLGGLVLGGLVLGYLYNAWMDNDKRRLIQESPFWALQTMKDWGNILVLWIILPLAAFLAFPNTGSIVAQWWGANLAFAAIAFEGGPYETRFFIHRIYRILVAITILISTSWLLSTILDGNYTPIRRASEVFLMIWLTVGVSKKMKWYSRLQKRY